MNGSHTLNERARLGCYPEPQVCAEHQTRLGIQCRHGPEKDEVQGEQDPLERHPDEREAAVVRRARRQQKDGQDRGRDQTDHREVHDEPRYLRQAVGQDGPREAAAPQDQREPPQEENDE